MTGFTRLRAFAFAALMALGAGSAFAADPDPLFTAWLGREYTINTSGLDDQFPLGGKLTFTFDAEGNVVRVCTRQASAAKGPWRNEMAPGCTVTLTFTAGSRYCTAEEVKVGNAEVLLSCHRLRRQDIATRSPAKAKAKAAPELHDLIVFLVKTPTNQNAIQILVDSPSRVTSGGGSVGGIP